MSEYCCPECAAESGKSWPEDYMTTARCKFGNDTCNGIEGGSLFVCCECVEDAEFEAAQRREGHPACELIEEDLTTRKPSDEETR